MALIKFRNVNFRERSREIVEQCNSIIDDYAGQGLKLTLRQLYYQLVTRNTITNEEKSYKNLGGIVSDARLAGLMDWDAIEDRVRQPRAPSEWPDLKALVSSALRAYRLPRWAGQSVYAELWVEKDALAGVLEPLAREYHVTLMVNRGYSSQSAMYEASRRFIDACEAQDGEEENGDYAHPEGEDGPEVPLARKPFLFYLGDHDPSGEDMVRDVRVRLEMFGVNVAVQKIALTTAQVKQYNPPPNPAKMSDSRAAAYVEKHGRYSWEVDALPPNVLARIVRSAFSSVLHKPTMNAVIRREEEDKKRLTEAVEQITSEGT